MIATSIYFLKERVLHHNDYNNEERIQYLDGIRGLLASVVAISHIYGSITGYSPGRPMEGASLAVDFFFILSGYVLTYILTGKNISPLRYISKRLFRLWPLYFLSIVLTLLAIIYNLNHGGYVPHWWNTTTSTDIILNFLMLNSVGLFRHLPVINEPSWSIAVEFWISGFLLYSIIFFRARKTALVISSCSYLLLFLNSINSGYWHSVLTFIFSETMMRGIAGITWGFVLFSLKPSIKIKNNAYLLFFQTVFIVAISYYLYKPNFSFTYPLVLFVSFLLLSINDEGLYGKLFSCHYLRWLGEISYSIYLIHTPVIIVMFSPLYKYCTYLGFSRKMIVLVCFTVILVCSNLVYKYFETPTRKWLYSKLKKGKGLL